MDGSYLGHDANFEEMPDAVLRFAMTTRGADSCCLAEEHDGEIVFRTFHVLDGTAVETVRETPATPMFVTKNVTKDSHGRLNIAFTHDDWNAYRAGAALMGRADIGRYDEWCERQVGSDNFSSANLLNPSELFNCSKYRYCGYSEKSGDALAYLRMYEKHPIISLFSKRDVPLSPRLIGYAEKKPTDFLEMTQKTRSFDTVLFALKNAVNLEDASKYLFYKKMHLKSIRELKKEYLPDYDIDRIAMYLCDLNIFLPIYRDYLRMVRGLSGEYEPFPEDFEKACAECEARVDELKEQSMRLREHELAFAFSCACREAGQYAFEHGDYKIDAPISYSEIRECAERFVSGIYTFGHHLKMARGGDKIFLIRKRGSSAPLALCEWDEATNKIVRLEGATDDDVRTFLSVWLLNTKQRREDIALAAL